MARGVYTVHWRVVSAVDGHASAGAFVFGILMDPAGAGATPADSSVSQLEAIGRSVFLVGLVLAIGCVSSVAFRFAGTRADAIAMIACALAAIGLALFAAAQINAAQTTIGRFVATAVGRGLLGRGIGVAAMLIGAGLRIVSTGRVSRVVGIVILAAGAIGCLVVHSLAGHAAAGRWPLSATVTAQFLHSVMVGAWLGGLVVLLDALRAGPNAPAIARFSNLAGVSLLVVAASGVVRGYQEIPDWTSLRSTAYGGLAAAKVVLLMLIAALGALNRWRNVGKASSNPGPLRRTAVAELNLALLAIVAAGVLGTLAPPAGAKPIAGLSASGTDFGTTIRASLNAVSNQPGPNRFTVRLEDYDSGATIDARHVALRFTPLDDPGIDPTQLALAKDAGGTFTGTGAQLAFPGRWRIEMLIERGNTSVTVPVDVDAEGLPQFTSVIRTPGAAPSYTIESGRQHSVQIIIAPERSGLNTLQISFMNVLFEPLPVDNVVVTVRHDEDPVKAPAVERVDRHRFSTRAEFARGVNRINVTARSETGTRIRATLKLILNSSD
jgi:copper transport protein